MKKIKFLIIIFAFGIITTQAQQQKLDPTGIPYSEIGNDQNANGSRAAIDYIFAYSSSIVSNGLVLNDITIPVYTSGWFIETGFHDSDNSNYICGLSGNKYYRNFFAFDLSTLTSLGITLPITSATLNIVQCSSDPASGTRTWNLSHVSTPYSTLNQNYPDPSATGSNIWIDLGDGESYGSIEVDRTLPTANVIQVILNEVALVDINVAAQSNSIIVLGGQMENVSSPVPVSNWAILIGLILIVVFIAFRTKRKSSIV